MHKATRLDAMPAGFYHAILNSIRDPFNIVDRDYRLLWVNPARARFHQRNQREMIGKTCYAMFQRRDRPCAECPVRLVFESGKPCVMDRSVVLPDGTQKWGNVRAYPVFDDKGRVVYAIQVMIDITKEKLNGARESRHVESLEKTVKELNGNHVRDIIRYSDGKEKLPLTPREIEVLGLIANGSSNSEVAKVLSISAHTVKSHVMNIMDKLGVKDRTQAAVWAVRRKLI
jgi:PAS domain S-box-containing protein